MTTRRQFLVAAAATCLLPLAPASRAAIDVDEMVTITLEEFCRKTLPEIRSDVILFEHQKRLLNEMQIDWVKFA